MLSLAPYLVTPSGLTGDAGITAGHYLHIFCWNHYTSGAVITGKAAFKKNKGEKKIRQDSQEENRAQIVTIHNFNSNAEGVSVHLGGLNWTTGNRNYFQLRVSLPHVSQVWEHRTPGLLSLKTSSLFSQPISLFDLSTELRLVKVALTATQHSKVQRDQSQPLEPHQQQCRPLMVLTASSLKTTTGEPKQKLFTWGVMLRVRTWSQALH